MFPEADPAGAGVVWDPATLKMVFGSHVVGGVADAAIGPEAGLGKTAVAATKAALSRDPTSTVDATTARTSFVLRTLVTTAGPPASAAVLLRRDGGCVPAKEALSRSWGV